MRINKLLFACIVTLLAVSMVTSLLLLCGRNNSAQQDENLMETVFVEGGTFQMGSDDIESYPSESPAHTVTLSGFRMGKYAVTVAQFARFVEETDFVTLAERDTARFYTEGIFNKVKPSGYFGKGAVITADASDSLAKKEPPWSATARWDCDNYGKIRPRNEWDDYPVVFVCYSDAKAYCDWLAMKTGKPYRLPTEAEWEFAARGGVHSRETLYSGSDDLDEVAWFFGNSDKKIHKIGTKKPNELGIYDMSGNVFEWTDDLMFNYTKESQVNPRYGSTQSVVLRATRGGSWSRYPSYCRVTDRFPMFSVTRGPGIGFRVAYPADK